MKFPLSKPANSTQLKKDSAFIPSNSPFGNESFQQDSESLVFQMRKMAKDSEDQNYIKQFKRMVKNGEVEKPTIQLKPVIQFGQGGSRESEEKVNRRNSMIDESPRLSDVQRMNLIKSAFDKISNEGVTLTRKLSKGDKNNHLRLWSPQNLKRDALQEIIQIALDNSVSKDHLFNLVLEGVCPGLEEARALIWNELSRRTGKGGIEPMGRLMPDIIAATEQERTEAGKNKLIEGNNTDKVQQRLKQLELRGAAAGKLDELRRIGLENQTQRPGDLDLDEIKVQIISYYTGPTEEGHEIWNQYKSAVDSLLESANQAGYPIWERDVQKAISIAANDLASYNSTGSWAGDREDNGGFMRR